jgi:hypothetical protein
MKISLDESVLNLLKKYIEENNNTISSDNMKYTIESAANALLARILINKYPI